MPYPSVTPTKQDKLPVPDCQAELERTSGSVRGTPAVAVSGYMAEGEGAVAPSLSPFSASIQTTNSPGGGGASSSLLDYYVISGRSPTPRLDDKSRRVRRFYQRYFTGVGVGGRLRFLTLTSSDEAIGQGLDVHRSFRALVKRMRRRWGRFEYMGVVEIKGDRHHLHLVFRGSYMQKAVISAMWASLHLSPIVDIKAVYKAKGGARYLAKYLAKEALNRYWASYNWVFAGWVGWSQRVNRAVGHYPSKGLLQSLAVLDKVKRRLAMDFLEYQYRPLWEWSLDNGNGR
ncbi:hypothetical protein ES705_47845 [subsurface metagenome]